MPAAGGARSLLEHHHREHNGAHCDEDGLEDVGDRLAEAVASPEYLRTYEGKVDGCLDFAWVEAARATFATRRMSLPAFERFLSRHDIYADLQFIRPTFIDNHDMNRILFMAGGDTRRVKLAAACQFTLSQPPVVLYGTEVGLSQRVDSRGDLDVTREPMPWDDRQDRDLLAGEFHGWLLSRTLCP